jgi:hypothetical protein
MQDINEQISLAPQPATAEHTNGGMDEQISLGKFKDVNALLSAYNSLQAEFTKRCQRLKELESKPVVDKENPPTKTETTEDKPSISITDENRQEILKDYLKGVLSSKPQATVIDGVGSGLKTPTAKPSSVSEAGRLAREMFSKNNND